MDLPTLDRRMLVGTVVTGVGAGVGGFLLTLLLHGVQHLAFGYTEGSFLAGVEHASAVRRVVAVTAGGLVVGLLWAFQRWRVTADVSVPRAVATEGRTLPVAPSVLDSVIQIVAVGAGASLGREGAPRLFGATVGARISRTLGLTEPQRRTLVACGAGAGFAAVYNVPLGGALFSLEVLLGSFALTEAAPALLTAAIAAVVAWPVLGDVTTYAVPSLTLRGPILVWALWVGPLAGVVGAAFRASARRVQARTPGGWRVVAGVTLAFALLGVGAIAYPQLLGNGKGAAQVALDGTLAAGTMGVLVLLKPLGTVLCLAAGARGGLLTPSWATGAVLGGATGVLWSHAWSGESPAAYALVGAATVLATTQRAPFTAAALGVEFTHQGLALIAPMAVAMALSLGTATLLARPEIWARVPLLRRLSAATAPSPAAPPR